MKFLHLLMLLLVDQLILNGQNIGIGTSIPDSSAALDIKASAKGLLMPRTSTASRIGILNPAKGLILYDSTIGNFWFYNGGAWSNILSATGPGGGWSLNGNTATNATNFIGTTDDQPLIFKVNNTKAGFLDYSLLKGNTAFGYATLKNNTSGIDNTATGYNSLMSNTIGVCNSAHGILSLYLNISGSNNTANGIGALFSNMEGNYNTATGAWTLNLSNGSFNTANGALSLNSNLTGENNTATGAYALYSNYGSSSTANGFKALYSNTTGEYNTAVGVTALYANTEGKSNTAIGLESLYSNQGSFNTAIGTGASKSNTFGMHNSAFGQNALFYNSEHLVTSTLEFGSRNTAIGSQALYNNIAGMENTALGYNALKDNILGHFNTGLGSETSTGENLRFATAIGREAKVACNNCMTLGGNTVLTRTKVGINFESPATDLHIMQQSDIAGNITRGIRLQRINNTFWRIYAGVDNALTFEWNNGGAGNSGWINSLGSFVDGSDARIKRNILPAENVLKKISMLQPKRYKFMQQDDNNQFTYGFLAQDVKNVFPEFVHERENGVMGITYSSFGVVAIKAIQEQQTIIEKLDKKIDAMQKEIIRLQSMQADIEMLKISLANKQ